MTFQNRTKDDDDDDDENNKNEEYSKAALTARLSNYCYKNNLKELLESDGYSLVYEKYTSVTRVYIADRKIGFDEMKKEDIVERTIVARGAVWGTTRTWIGFDYRIKLVKFGRRKCTRMYQSGVTRACTR